METSNSAKLILEQALLLSENNHDKNNIDYDKIVETVFRATKMAKEQIYKDPKRLITQFEAGKRYGTKVISRLLKRRLISPYRFDIRDVGYDLEGNPIKKAAGAKYFRVSDIEEAIEAGNVLKETKRGVI